VNVAAQRTTRRPFGSVAVPKNVYFLLGLFLVLEYTRVPSLIPTLSVLRSQLFLILLLVIAWLRYADRNDLTNPIVKSVLVFAFLCAISISYTPNTRAAFNMTANILAYLAAIILPLLAFVRSVERLKWFLQLFVLSNTFIAVWAITHAGTGPGGFISDENDCALVLNVATPFAIALAAWPGQSRVMKLTWLGCGLLLLAGSISTLSRGGFIGILACAGAGFWYAPRKLRVVGILLVSLAIAVPLSPLLLPSRYIGRIQSIEDPNDGTRLNRIYYWKLGWIMYRANPVLGVGAGNYPWTVTDYERRLPPEQLFRGHYSGGRAAHSLYLTLLPELGTVGVIVFGTLVTLVIQTGRRMLIQLPRAKVQAPRGPPPQSVVCADRQALDVVGRAIVSSCAAYLGTGAFISVLYYPSFWHLAGIAAAAGATYASLGLPPPTTTPSGLRPARGTTRA
jgi:O-antigen ligase